MEFGRFGKIQEISGLREIQWTSVGFGMALSMNSVGIPGGFRCNAGFLGERGVWSGFGRFGWSNGFAQIVALQSATAFQQYSPSGGLSPHECAALTNTVHKAQFA